MPPKDNNFDTLPTDEAFNQSLQRLDGRIQWHEVHDQKQSILSRAVSYAFGQTSKADQSLEELRELRKEFEESKSKKPEDRKYTKEERKRLEAKVEELRNKDRQVVDNRDFYTSLGTSAIKSASLFTRGGTGYALTGLTHGLDRLNTNRSGGRQVGDFALGFWEGTLSKYLMGRIGELKINGQKIGLAQTGILFGTSGRLTWALFDSDNLIDKDGRFTLDKALTKAAADTLNPLALGFDVASFGIAHGLGHIAPGSKYIAQVVEKHRWLAPCIENWKTGTAFGLSNGFSGDTLAQIEEMKREGKFNYDLGRALKAAGTRALVDGMASVAGHGLSSGIERTGDYINTRKGRGIDLGRYAGTRLGRELEKSPTLAQLVNENQNRGLRVQIGGQEARIDHKAGIIYLPEGKEIPKAERQKNVARLLGHELRESQTLWQFEPMFEQVDALRNAGKTAAARQLAMQARALREGLARIIEARVDKELGQELSTKNDGTTILLTQDELASLSPEALEIMENELAPDGITYKQHWLNEYQGYAGKEINGVSKFDAVNNWLFRGGKPTEEGIANLHRLGVRTIISLRSEYSGDHIAEKAACEKLGIDFISIPMLADITPNKAEIDKFFKAVEDGQATGNVFVHCAAGKDRTGCMIGLYRVMHDGYSFEQAYIEMRAYGFDNARYGNLVNCVWDHASASKNPERSEYRPRVDFSSENSEHTTIENLPELRLKGIEANKEGKFDVAEQFFELCVSQCKKEPSRQSDLFRSLCNLSLAKINLNKMTEAERIFEEAQVIRESQPPGFNSDISAVSLIRADMLFGDIKFALGKFSEAENKYNTAINHLKSLNANPYDPMLAYLRFKLANTMKEPSRYNEAQSLYEQALKTLNLYPEKELEVMDGYSDFLRRAGHIEESKHIEARAQALRTIVPDFSNFQERQIVPDDWYPSSNALEQSLQYYRGSFIGDKLEPGFQSNPVIASSTNDKGFDSNGKPIGVSTVFDPNCDPVMQKLFAHVDSAFGNLKSDPENLAIALTQYVAKILTPQGGNEVAIDYHHSFAGQIGKQILLGEHVRNRAGVCHQRALLLKVLADHMGLNFSLNRCSFEDPESFTEDHECTTSAIGDVSRIYDSSRYVFGKPISECPEYTN